MDETATQRREARDACVDGSRDTPRGAYPRNLHKCGVSLVAGRRPRAGPTTAGRIGSAGTHKGADSPIRNGPIGAAPCTRRRAVFPSQRQTLSPFATPPEMPLRPTASGDTTDNGTILMARGRGPSPTRSAVADRARHAHRTGAAGMLESPANGRFPTIPHRHAPIQNMVSARTGHRRWAPPHAPRARPCARGDDADAPLPHAGAGRHDARPRTVCEDPSMHPIPTRARPVPDVPPRHVCMSGIHIDAASHSGWNTSERRRHGAQDPSDQCLWPTSAITISPHLWRFREECESSVKPRFRR